MRPIQLVLHFIHIQPYRSLGIQSSVNAFNLKDSLVYVLSTGSTTATKGHFTQIFGHRVNAQSTYPHVECFQFIVEHLECLLPCRVFLIDVGIMSYRGYCRYAKQWGARVEKDNATYASEHYC